jgi:serine/threonine protein kinase
VFLAQNRPENRIVEWRQFYFVNAADEPNREKALFEQALDLASVAERLAFLKGACGEDAALLARVQALLHASETAKGFLADKPAAQTILLPAKNMPASEKPGDRIGRYKLREKIGEGGCGVVYVAEQEEPVRRKVALKVIKLGMDTESVVARFGAERQALAMMDHPNIARVFDAGATETGRPYFVMELVRGIKITDYCDLNHLPTQERLDLFIKVCQAIQHAHQKGIIHRDIKPSNILVTLHDGVPVPKVIDFGIAKATEGRLTDATVYTQLHQFLGTPAYMSPEQAEMSGLDIDTRSDIYSLGVLLYELLTGCTPFDAQELAKAGLDAIRNTIREVEPLRPSTRLGTLQGAALAATAKQHSTESGHLLKLIRGDLDWIVMKCLEKDRSRRYETANGLAMELKRHLNNEPVLARPPTTTYRLLKAWRRKKSSFIVTVAKVAIALGAGMAVWVKLGFGSHETIAALFLALLLYGLLVMGIIIGVNGRGRTFGAVLAEIGFSFRKLVALVNAGQLRLQTASWLDGEVLQFDLKFPSGIKMGIKTLTADAGTVDGRPIWRLGWLGMHSGAHILAGTGDSYRVEVAANTFHPIHSRCKHPLFGDVEAAYTRRHVTLKKAGELAATKIALGGVAFDNTAVLHLIRRLPLAVGYQTTLRILSTLNGASIVPICVTVTGREAITVKAGTFDCFRVELSINQTYWYTTNAQHYLVKFEAGLTVGELSAVRQRKLGETAKHQDASLGFSVTTPTDWILFRTETEDKRQTRLMIADAEAQGVIFLQVRSLDSLPAEQKQSLRHWGETEIKENYATLLEDFQLRLDSWKDCLVAGRNGVSVVGDFVTGTERKVASAVFTFGRTTAAAFVLTIAARDYEAFKPKFDRLVDSYSDENLTHP